MATTIQRCRIAQTAWTEWPNPPRATLRAVVTVAGADDGDAVGDVARELAERLDWGVYNVNVVPETSLPLEGEQGEVRLEAGALVVVTDPNQGQPELEDGSPEPAVSDVRIRFEQAITFDLADRPVLLQRRRDIRRVFSRLHGLIGGAVQ